MQAWNWGAQAPQAAANFASPQAFPGQVAQVYQSGQVAQAYPGAQMPQGFPAAPPLVPGQQLMTNYQQFYGGAMPTAATEIPAGYTAQQWEAAQQQHFIQWQQWNQQYQQWQQEYGNTYSMAVQGGQSALPPSSTAEPPPLPPPDKPPPPPEEGRVEQPNFQIPPPDTSANFKGQKRPTEDDQSKYQGPADKKQRSDNFQQFGRDGAANTWGSTADPEVGLPHGDEEDRSEQERVFDSQFLNWEGEFLSWKEQNINHPDKNQYNEYEKKWTKWRQELLQRREQMRRKRLASMAKGSPDAVASKGRSKGDRATFPDTKTIRNLGNEFNDATKQPVKDAAPVLHPDGFGFRGGQANQQPQMGQGTFPTNGKPEIKSLLDLPLQFTGQYAKKGYGSVEKDADNSKPAEASSFVDPQKPQASQQGDQNKSFQKTWAPNFQGPLQPKINFNFNKSGNNQFENANGSSQATYGPHPKPVGPLGTTQNMAPDSGQNIPHANQDFTKDVQLDSMKPFLQKSAVNSAAEKNSGEIIDITDDKEVAPNYDFLKKSSVIPGLDLFPEKGGDVHKKIPSNESKSSQPQFVQEPHFDSRTQTSQGQGFEFLKGTGTGGQFGPNKVPGQGLMPPPGFGGNPSVNPWPGQGDGQQGFGMNRPGQGFQGNVPGFGPFGPVGQPGSGPGNQPSYFVPGGQNQNIGNSNEGPGNHNQNFGQGNQGPYMGPQNNSTHMGMGNQNPNFNSPGNMGPNSNNPGNMGPNFTSPGNKGQNLGPANQNPNMMSNYNNAGNKIQNMGPGNQNQNFSPGNMGPGYTGGPGNQGPNVGLGANQGFGPGNMGPNFSPNMKGPGMIQPLIPPNFGSGGPGGPMNMGPGNQNSNFGAANSGQNNAGPNFGPGNQNSNAGSGSHGSNFNPMDQMNRNNQGFGNQNFGPKNMDPPGFIRDQPPPRRDVENQNFPASQFGGGPRNWGDQDTRNQGPQDKLKGQGPNNWSENADNSGPWNQGGSGRDLQHPGPLRDANQGPRDNFPSEDVGHRPGDKFPGGPMNKFPPKDGFADGNKSGPIDSFPGGKEPFPKSFPQGTREDFPGPDKFGGPRDGFPKDGPPNFPPNRENYSKDGPGFPGQPEGFPKDADFPDVRERPPAMPGMRDRPPVGDPGFPGEGPPRGRFGDDREPFPDRFPHDEREDFARERFVGRDRFGPADVPRIGYPEREFDRDPFRDDFRGREAAFHGDRARGMEFGERGNSFFPRDHELANRDYDQFDRSRSGERGGWDQRAGGRPPPHDYYRPRQFDEREGDPYSQWDRAQRPPGWDAVMEPVTIVEYGHKPAPVAPIMSEALAAANLLENVQTFDYAHGATPKNARDPGPPPATEPWRRDELFGRQDREPDRDKRPHEREGRWERDRDRGRRGDDEDRFRGKPDDRWGRRGDGDRDRNARSRDGKRDGDSGRVSKSGPPPAPPPPPSFSSPTEGGKGGGTNMTSAPTPPSQRPILVEDLLSPPGRDTRPQRIVIILRGPPGSGKSFVAKLIKDKEVEMGGPPPRILCLDDYFMVEVEKEEKEPESGRKVKVKVMEYEYEAGMEKDYRCSLVKAFKKTVNENYFPFVIVDCVNQVVKNFEEMWSYAKQKGFQVYICEMDMDVSSCIKRNTHNRTEKEIATIVKGWEETPKYYLRLDVRSLLQSVAITEVEMEDSTANEEEEKKEEVENEKEKTAGEEGADADEDNSVCISKWERMEPSGDKLDRLDGLRRLKSEDKPKTLEDWLQLSDDYDKRETKPGQKRVRWADLEEKREQEKMRAIGFVVGQTDWSRMTDPTRGESALTQTKYI